MKKIMLPLIIFALCASNVAFGFSPEKHKEFKDRIARLREFGNINQNSVTSIETKVDKLKEVGIEKLHEIYLSPKAWEMKNYGEEWEKIENQQIRDLSEWLGGLEAKVPVADM